MSTHFRGLRESLSEIRREVTALSQKRDSRRTRRPLSFGDGALQELSEGLAERKDLSESVGGEIGAGRFHVGAFATDLYHADDAIAAENRRADNFLDDFRGFGGEFNALEYAGVPNGGEMIDDFGAAFAGGARGERGFAGEGDEADILEHFWNDEVQMPPAMRTPRMATSSARTESALAMRSATETNEICG